MDWLFQCNPKRYDLADVLDRGGTSDTWAMNQGRRIVSPGDRAFFWQTGNDAQLLVIGKVVSPVYQREGSEFGRYCVDVTFEHRIRPPLKREEILLNPLLRTFPAFKGVQGTNFLIHDPEVV